MLWASFATCFLRRGWDPSVRTSACSLKFPLSTVWLSAPDYRSLGKVQRVFEGVLSCSRYKEFYGCHGQLLSQKGGLHRSCCAASGPTNFRHATSRGLSTRGSCSCTHGAIDVARVDGRSPVGFRVPSIASKTRWVFINRLTTHSRLRNRKFQRGKWAMDRIQSC